MKTKKAWLVKVGGEVTRLPQIEGKELKLSECYPIIGCSTIEHVGLKKGVDMWIDEEGLFKNPPVLNWIATDLYRKAYPKIDPKELVIVGDVIITDNTKKGYLFL